MKNNNNNFRASAIPDIMKHIKSEGIPIIIYEPTINDVSETSKFKVDNDIDQFNAKVM